MLFSAAPFSTLALDGEQLLITSAADTHDGASGAIRKQPTKAKFTAELAAQEELREALDRAAGRPVKVKKAKKAPVAETAPAAPAPEWDEEAEIAAIQQHAAEQQEALALEMEKLIASLPKPKPKAKEARKALMASLKQFRETLKQATAPRQVIRDAAGKITEIR